MFSLKNLLMWNEIIRNHTARSDQDMLGSLGSQGGTYMGEGGMVLEDSLLLFSATILSCKLIQD